MRYYGLLVFLIATAVATVFFVLRARRGKVAEIRPIAGLVAIEEGVGRAVEMGKVVHFFIAAEAGLTQGRGTVGSLAALAVLRHTAKLTAQKEARLVFACNNPELTILGEDVIRTAYTGEGKLESFDHDEMIKYYSSLAYKNAISGYLMRERPAVSMLMGDISNEAALLADMSYQAGCMTISGCQRETQLPMLVAISDYALVGEELLVAGAFLTGDRQLLGSVAGQDLLKYASIALGLAGAVMATAGVPWISNFFK